MLGKQKAVNAVFPTLTAYLKQMTGIEPASPAWEAGILPMNYICISTLKIITRFDMNCKCFLHESVNLPVDRLDAVAFQKLICLAERSAAEESAKCRQRTGMRRRQDQMLGIV